MLRIWKPSIWMFESVVRPPWIVKALASRRLLVPPTSCTTGLMPAVVDSPGMRMARLRWLRPDRNRVDHLLLHHALRGGVLHVDDRRFAGHRDRFLDSADLSSALTVAVNDPVSSMPSRLTVVKPGQRERHRVGAGPQVDDPVLAGAVGDDRADLLDQRRAGRFDGHAGQHGAGRVPRGAGDGGLRRCDGRK